MAKVASTCLAPTITLPQCTNTIRLALQMGEAGGEKVLGNGKGCTHLPRPYRWFFWWKRPFPLQSPPMPKASIIIPHLNGKQHLDDCLGSLRRQSCSDFEVLLVDNGSTDGTQVYVRDHFPEVQLIELGSNRGFTGACNAGWEAAKGNIIILPNNDTEVDPNWLREVLAAFEQNPQVGIVASKMLLFDKRDQFHTAGDFYRVDGLPGNRGVWQKDVGQYDQPEPVFSACGGSAAYRRTMLDEIGFLDDDFFFSCEDVDIGWRAQLAGWQVLYVPTAVVYHKLKATGGSVTGSYYDGRNFLYLIWKNY
ncbi:MAG: glycosyltransferase family 2 protein, partial [Chloroflexi bacterium]|nr:glycosyltransferase family 2 protein [Chloroflexota bacterium]